MEIGEINWGVGVKVYQPCNKRLDFEKNVNDAFRSSVGSILNAGPTPSKWR